MAVIEFDPKGNIHWANDIFLGAVGYTLAQIQGKHHRMFMDPDDAATPAYRELWQRLGGGEHISGSFRRMNAAGDEMWLQATYAPVLDDAGRVVKVIKFASVITDEVRAKANAEGQLAAIREVQAIIEFAVDGTILYANDLFLRAVGYREDEVVGQHHRMFLVPGSISDADYRSFWQRLAAGHVESGNFERMGKHSARIWLEATYNPIFGPDGRVIKVVKYARDITNRIASVDHLGATSQALTSNAERIRQASDLVKRSEEVARDGGTQLAALTAEMAGLDQSSKKIVDIIELVNAIALQTNLLALNASVEASRAGEAGRGFAVVADEIRELAQRTKSAAAEIKQLISTSVEQINHSSASAKASGEIMEEMVNTVSEATSMIDTVTADTTQQARDLEAVSGRLMTRRVGS